MEQPTPIAALQELGLAKKALDIAIKELNECPPDRDMRFSRSGVYAAADRRYRAALDTVHTVAVGLV